jgi:hypothetical protein|tara:strand:+ start:187 stop:312 length:126 start_codon:yes stop_codon:yes gene_type:complete
MQPPPDQTKLAGPGEQIADLCERAEAMLNDCDNKASYLRQA